jgi:hypothetical protein
MWQLNICYWFCSELYFFIHLFHIYCCLILILVVFCVCSSALCFSTSVACCEVIYEVYIKMCHIHTGDQKSKVWTKHIECFSRNLVIETDLDGVNYLCLYSEILPFPNLAYVMLCRKRFMHQHCKQFELRNSSALFTLECSNVLLDLIQRLVTREMLLT